MIKAPLRSRASTTRVASQARDDPVPRGKPPRSGLDAGGYSDTISPSLGDRRSERPVRAWVVAVDPQPEHGDGRACLERTAVGRRVDTTGEPRHDDDTRSGEASSELRRDRRAVREHARAPTTATQGAPSSVGSPPPRTKSPGGGSWIFRSRGGNPRSRRAIQR